MHIHNYVSFIYKQDSHLRCTLFIYFLDMPLPLGGVTRNNVRTDYIALHKERREKRILFSDSVSKNM